MTRRHAALLQAAAVRVEARFGPALPPGCPDPLDAHSSLAALPPDLMALLEGFMQQERCAFEGRGRFEGRAAAHALEREEGARGRGALQNARRFEPGS